ncbi:MAG TPA: sugar ABC transporter ATP-binding protein, partial [Candidatus Limnocylindrales bacterium]|nr:sugar ABC transporter ATP-binding protein [Candidatus Limnocylindrales bacterium]
STAVRLRGVSKRFGATQALAAVDLDILAGETHALVGQNGAGKSTLGKIIGGIYARDEGTFEAFGSPVGQWSPRMALQRGIAMIQQELSLVPELSVAQNVFLGIERHRFALFSGSILERFEELNARPRFRLDPRVRIRDLRVADRQKVEILRALSRDARLIVMDEPSSALSIDEADHLHEVVAWLRDDGRTVVYVSHFLDEVLKACERVTVMRDGRIIRTTRTSEETRDSLVSGMLGRSMALTFPTSPQRDEGHQVAALRVDHLSARPSVLDVSLEVRAGEIVGIAGLVGSGRSEVLRSIFGADASDGGSVVLGDAAYVHRSPHLSVELGLGMIPEDRRGQGLITGMSVRANVGLANLSPFVRSGLLSRAAERSAVTRLMGQLDIVPRRTESSVATFSGGNQQKILFAKWLNARPQVLMLDEPTRGVDIGAKRNIYDLIVGLAGEGIGILLVSSELEEVMELASRVYLMHEGRTFETVHPATTTLDDVLVRLFALQDEQAVA